MIKKRKIHLIAAARPNFMKIAPLYHALKQEDWAHTYIVHTGQHYDVNMSDAFFSDLKLPNPDIHLGIGNGTHAEQTGRVMISYEKILMDHQPDLVIVVGDVNSTMACTIAASKISYPNNSKLKIQNSKLSKDRNRLEGSNKNRVLNRPIIAHLEAGLRSFDRTMPEEINRLVTDSLADILWTPSFDGDENLMNEGVSSTKIFRVGNIMIDSLEMLREKIEKENTCKDIGVKGKQYGVVTLHRPSNVDDKKKLKSICDQLRKISSRISLVFPIHPRTLKSLKQNGLYNQLICEKGLITIEPQNYIRFMNLIFKCRLVITDSGGIQEETTYLGIPCLTLRPNTERPITVQEGTNRLCNIENISSLVNQVLSEKRQDNQIPELWDGHTSARVVQQLKDFFEIK